MKVIKPYFKKDNPDDIEVNGTLAITPAKMQKLSEQGIPISSQVINQVYFDGENNPSWDVPMDRKRGIDINDMWQHEQNVKTKLKRATKDAIKLNRKDKQEKEV